MHLLCDKLRIESPHSLQMWDGAAFLLAYLLCGKLGTPWLRRNKFAIAGGTAAAVAAIEVCFLSMCKSQACPATRRVSFQSGTAQAAGAGVGQTGPGMRWLQCRHCRVSERRACNSAEENDVQRQKPARLDAALQVAWLVHEVRKYRREIGDGGSGDEAETEADSRRPLLAEDAQQEQSPV